MHCTRFTINTKLHFKALAEEQEFRILNFGLTQSVQWLQKTYNAVTYCFCNLTDNNSQNILFCFPLNKVKV